jgi:hypothetical protein
MWFFYFSRIAKKIALFLGVKFDCALLCVANSANSFDQFKRIFIPLVISGQYTSKNGKFKSGLTSTEKKRKETIAHFRRVGVVGKVERKR